MTFVTAQLRVVDYNNTVDGGQAMSEPFEYAWEITAVVATVLLLALYV